MEGASIRIFSYHGRVTLAKLILESHHLLLRSHLLQGPLSSKLQELLVKSGILLKRVADDLVQQLVHVRLVVEVVQKLEEAVPEGVREELPSNFLGSTLKGSRNRRCEKRERRRGRKKENEKKRK